MIVNFIKLIAGGIIGSYVSIVNLLQAVNVTETTINAAEFTVNIINRYVGVANGIAGFAVAGVTFYYLYWQTAKIKQDLKQKKAKKGTK